MACVQVEEDCAHFQPATFLRFTLFLFSVHYENQYPLYLWKTKCKPSQPSSTHKIYFIYYKISLKVKERKWED